VVVAAALADQCRLSELTHKATFNALPAAANFRRSLILARGPFDQPPKPALEGKKWDKGAIPSRSDLRRLLTEADVSAGSNVARQTGDCLRLTIGGGLDDHL
jgi:hypothetical protein